MCVDVSAWTCVDMSVWMCVSMCASVYGSTRFGKGIRYMCVCVCVCVCDFRCAKVTDRVTTIAFGQHHHGASLGLESQQYYSEHGS